MAVLTISREFGSGGGKIGREVADSLGYDFVDKERLMSDISAHGKKWRDWGKDLDEHCPTLWEKYDWSFRGFTALMESHILDYALKDKVVIIGRGGNFLLKDVPYALRVRISAPLETRVERILNRESVDRETAIWLIERTDRERSCLIHLIYGKRWDDPREYDMVFDSGVRTEEEIRVLLNKALIERDRLYTDEARHHLAMRATAAKVKAGILTSPGLFVPTLDVFYDGQRLILRGIIHNPHEHKKIEAEAERLAGDAPIKCELRYRG